MEKKFYHEKQSLLNCGIHAVNNLLQEEKFSKEDFNEIAADLEKSFPSTGFFSQYRTWGLGNFDASVLVVALQKVNLEVSFFKAEDKIEEIPFQNLVGIIVNRQRKHFLGFWHSKHWFSLIRIQKEGEQEFQWMNCDSKLSATQFFPTIQSLITFLKHLQQEGSTFLLITPQSQKKNEETINYETH